MPPRACGATPPPAVAAVLILAIAIAATTSMFALVRGILLRPLPVRAQERLILSWKDLPSAGYTHHHFGDREIDAVSRSSRLLEAVAGLDANGASPALFVDDGNASYARSAFVTGRLFEVLGVEPVLGRALRAEDDVDGAELVTVISRGFWQRRYGASPDVLGRRVEIAQQSFTIVGVMPDLDVPVSVELWRTTHSTSTTGPFGDAARREIDLVGRLKPGVTLDQARSELAMMTAELERSAPAGNTRGLVPVVLPLADRDRRRRAAGHCRVDDGGRPGAADRQRQRRQSRAAARREPASGAGRAGRAGRVAAGCRVQCCAESVVLTLAAGFAGVTLAWWTLRALVAQPARGPAARRRHQHRRRRHRVRWPSALASPRRSLVLCRRGCWRMVMSPAPLRGGGRGSVGGPGRRMRRALVVLQVSLAVAIVAAAGLLVRTVVRLQSIDIGLCRGRARFIELSLPQEKYGQRARHEQFLDAGDGGARRCPGVAAATPVNIAPFSAAGTCRASPPRARPPNAPPAIRR